jgi:general secretion pathway protein I
MAWRTARGFTLLEVLVALIIVAFGMGAVLAALSSAADSSTRLREKSFAEWIGFNQLSTARLALQSPGTGSSTGEVDFANEHWHWRQQVEALDIPGVQRITVDVARTPAGTAAATDDTQTDWLATVVGFRGDAINAASGEQPDWNGTAFAGAAGGDGGSGGGPLRGSAGGPGRGDGAGRDGPGTIERGTPAPGAP